MTSRYRRWWEVEHEVIPGKKQFNLEKKWRDMEKGEVSIQNEVNLDLLIDPIFDDIKAELLRAQQQFDGMHSLHEAYAVIAEELDELWDIVREKNSHEYGTKARKECIQIAAMAIRAIMDRNLK